MNKLSLIFFILLILSCSKKDIGFKDIGLSSDRTQRELKISWKKVKSKLPIHLKVGSFEGGNDLAHEYIEDVSTTSYKLKLSSRPKSNNNTYHISILHYPEDSWESYDIVYTLDDKDPAKAINKFSKCTLLIRPIVFGNESGDDIASSPTEEEFINIQADINQALKKSNLEIKIESPLLIKNTPFMLGIFGIDKSNNKPYNFNDFIRIISKKKHNNLDNLDAKISKSFSVDEEQSIELIKYTNSLAFVPDELFEHVRGEQQINLLFFKHPPIPPLISSIKNFIIFKNYEKKQGKFNSLELAKNIATILGLKSRSYQHAHGLLPIDFDIKNSLGIMNQSISDDNISKTLEPDNSFTTHEILTLRDSDLIKCIN